MQEVYTSPRSRLTPFARSGWTSSADVVCPHAEPRLTRPAVWRVDDRSRVLTPIEGLRSSRETDCLLRFYDYLYCHLSSNLTTYRAAPFGGRTPFRGAEVSSAVGASRCLRLSLVGVLVSSLVSGLGLLNSPPAASAATSTSGDVSLVPAAGQFTPLLGIAVLDSRNGTGAADPSLTPGTTLTLSVTTVGGTTTGVPVDPSAVVLEFNTQATFADVLSAGAVAGATDTSLTFPANTERNGFDIVTPASDGTIDIAITGFAPILAGATLMRLGGRKRGRPTERTDCGALARAR